MSFANAGRSGPGRANFRGRRVSRLFTDPSHDSRALDGCCIQRKTRRSRTPTEEVRPTRLVGTLPSVKHTLRFQSVASCQVTLLRVRVCPVESRHVMASKSLKIGVLVSPFVPLACHNSNMNRLSTEKRVTILHALCEGMSMRSASRLTGVALNTIARLLDDASEAAAAFHDENVRGLQSRFLQCDEIWGFAWCKERTLPYAKGAPPGSGSVWTWTAIDADSKVLVSYTVGPRDPDSALYIVSDLRDRVDGRFQISTDGLTHYRAAIETVFGGHDVDHGVQIKTYGRQEVEDWRRYSPSQCMSSQRFPVVGNPDPDQISTSYVERHNLTMRMGMRRFTRLTNGFSKKIERHAAMVDLYAWHYNWCRPHRSLSGATPAMEAGLTPTFHSLEELVELINDRAPPVRRPKRYKKRGSFEADPYGA